MADRTQLLDDPEASLRLALSGWQGAMWTATPAIVTAVNLAKMTLTCRPAIQGVTTNENGVSTFVNMPLLDDVPIVFPSAGGFLLTFPIKVGDEVLVIFGARCIDSWWQNGGTQKPMEARMHDLSDGFAIPGPRSLPKVAAAISATEAQLRNDAGDAYISIKPDGTIKLSSATGIEVNGNLAVSGNITATEVTAGVVPLSTHKHIGVTPGGGTSGTPVP